MATLKHNLYTSSITISAAPTVMNSEGIDQESARPGLGTSGPMADGRLKNEPICFVHNALAKQAPLPVLVGH